MRKEFKYQKNKNNIASKIIHGLADYINPQDGQKLLDVGCGSGALSIVCALKNLNAQIIGLDKWGKLYPFYNQKRCELNAKFNNLNNIKFIQGNATKLDFADEEFDIVVSNFVYHNIRGSKEDYILETLRTLKKGGTFVIHDIFSKPKYKNINNFVDKLKSLGYSSVELIATDNGKFYTKRKASLLSIKNRKILYGIK